MPKPKLQIKTIKKSYNIHCPGCGWESTGYKTKKAARRYAIIMQSFCSCKEVKVRGTYPPHPSWVQEG